MKKLKRVNFNIIAEMAGDQLSEPYRLLREVRNKYHNDLSEAKIALAWRANVKADVDGHVVLGTCVKVSELYREFAEYDFIVVLNKQIWDSSEFDRVKKIALLDHELCHAAPAVDADTGERKYDERRRQLFRVRKHDIEEFASVVAHHGTYKRDLEAFADLLVRKASTPLLNRIEAAGKEVEEQPEAKTKAARSKA